jgi:hypothetical protein
LILRTGKTFTCNADYVDSASLTFATTSP